MRSSRLLALFAAPALLLGGCQSLSNFGDEAAASVGLGDDVPKAYTASEESTPHRSGIAVADEPLAAQSGAAALAAGGSAVDAAATMFFTLSVTYPVAAGLGSGGICLVHEIGGQGVEFDFLTKAPKAGGAYALPGSVAGFASMQRLYGALPWQRVVAPAEAYAATGFPISQALAARLVSAQNILRLDASLAGEFLDQNGQPLPARAEARNLALGLTLGQIRQNKADGFYKGDVAGRMVAYSTAQGGGISAAELAATVPLQGPARSRGTGGFVTWLPGPRTGAGAFTAGTMDNLSRDLRAGRDPALAMTQAARETLAGFGVGALPRDLGSTGFAAVDANGQAVSCALTMNGPFGSGRTASGTGVVLAQTPSSTAGLASAFLTPVIATSGGQLGLVGAGAGGPNGTAAALYAVLEAAGGRELGKRGDLRGTGAEPFDTVNMISCGQDACVALTDPAAHGAGVAAETLAEARP